VRFVPPIPGLYACYTHADCVCNEVISARNRVQGRVPRPNNKGLRAIKLALRRIAAPMHGTKQLSMDQFVACYTGRRRGRYQAACDNIRNNGHCDINSARVNAFVKAEKFNPHDKVNPDPRMIQCRSYEYNVELGCYLKPMEHQLYGITGPTGLRAIAKGLNMLKRASLLKEKMAQFKNPVVFSIDGSRWDKHIDVKVLDLEHGFYQRLNSDPRLAQLLGWQRKNRCRTGHGVKWSVLGKRMSGDMNTALGNCLLMVAMVYAAMKELSVRKWDLLDDGDDCLVLVEEEDLGKMEWGLGPTFLSFGQEIKIENIARRMEDVRFCQTRPVLVRGKWLMVRDWVKVLSTACCGVRHWNDPALVRPMFAGIGQCELALSQGVPVLQAFAVACVRNSRGACKPKWFDHEYQQGKYAAGWAQGAGPVEIDWEARESFTRAFGLSELQQVDIEKMLDAWEVDEVVARDVPPELDHRWIQDVDVEDPFLQT
jgi:hypothetical protein